MLIHARQHSSFFFFFNDTATTEIYTLSLHDALPISEHHGLDLFRTGKGGEDELARAREGLRALRPLGAPVEVRLRRFRPHVVDDEGVAGLHEVQGHRPAHVPQPDESDSHTPAFLYGLSAGSLLRNS